MIIDMIISSRKTPLILFLVLIVLAFSTVALARLNIRDTRQIQGSADEYFEIITPDRTTQVWRDDIERLGMREFSAVMNTSTGLTESLECEGVSLRRLLENNEIAFTRTNSVVVVGEDGYHARYSGAEVEDEAIYIVTQIDGQPLPPRRAGGMGTFLAVVRRDQYAQRWCKHLIEVRVE